MFVLSTLLLYDKKLILQRSGTVEEDCTKDIYRHVVFLQITFVSAVHSKLGHSNLTSDQSFGYAREVDASILLVICGPSQRRNVVIV